MIIVAVTITTATTTAAAFFVQLPLSAVSYVAVLNHYCGWYYC
jgi:hypothetical protein